MEKRREKYEAAADLIIETDEKCTQRNSVKELIE